MSKECDTYLHVDTSNLQYELRVALKEDESRKKTDEMKKRAIHTAKSYDEFEHMVSCAQLIPITRKEMEMLSDTKRGWRGRSGLVHSSIRAKPSGESQQNNLSSRRSTTFIRSAGASKKDRLRAPRSYTQFQRIWRQRCQNDAERRYYMRLIGPESLPTLFRFDMEPQVLAQMLSIVCIEFRMQRKEQGNVSVSSLFTAKDSVDTNALTLTEESTKCCDSDTFSTQVATCCLEWLDALSRTSRFKFNIKFLRQAEKSELSSVFGLITAAFAENFDKKLSAVNLVQNAYDLS